MPAGIEGVKQNFSPGNGASPPIAVDPTTITKAVLKGQEFLKKIADNPKKLLDKINLFDKLGGSSDPEPDSPWVLATDKTGTFDWEGAAIADEKARRLEMPPMWLRDP